MVRDNRGRFKKGASGNPSGRPPMELSVSTLVDRAVSPEDWQKIIGILLTRAQRGDLKAVEMLLDRRFGKPAQRQEVTGADGSAIKTENVVIYMPDNGRQA